MANNIKKLPFPDWLAKTPCTITLNRNGVGRNGEPIEAVTWTGKCIFSEKEKTVIDADGKKITLLGEVIVKGDIAPTLKSISDGQITISDVIYLNGELFINSVPISEGEITINGVPYEIHKGYRPRNPDGSVHHTKFEVK